MPLHLFQATGVELEYMIVDRETLAVRPIADKLIEAASGDPLVEPDIGGITWSNELAQHLVEFKTTEPAAALSPLPAHFHASVRHANQLLEPLGARLMPAAMHPFMDPLTEMHLWPHDGEGVREIYRTFDSIFSCTGHGWANLQSMHLNLPFEGDEEFGRLHAATRFILPILPALAASSPIVESRPTGLLDSRLEVYRHNSRRIPSVAGLVIPEPVYTEAGYRRVILEPIWRDLAPHDPEGLLRHEWANARGCIARFDRGSIEIRVIDVQECPAADIAIAEAVVAVVKALADGAIADTSTLREWPVEPLYEILLGCIKDADAAVIDNSDYLRQVGLPAAPLAARDLWASLVTRATGTPPTGPLATLLSRGCLSRRLLVALGKPGISGGYSRSALLALCRRLCDCVESNTMFLP